MSVASCWSHFQPLGSRGISLVCRWSPWSPSSAVSALHCNLRRQDGQSHTEERCRRRPYGTAQSHGSKSCGSNTSCCSDKAVVLASGGGGALKMCTWKPVFLSTQYMCTAYLNTANKCAWDSSRQSGSSVLFYCPPPPPAPSADGHFHFHFQPHPTALLWGTNHCAPSTQADHEKKTICRPTELRELVRHGQASTGTKVKAYLLAVFRVGIGLGLRVA